jgi:tetratricopeptide (TPR) repeat protein
VILCGCLGLLTARQATAYRDLETLYRHTLAGNPQSFLAINNLADVFIARGQLAEAVPLLNEAIRLSSTESHRTLARVTLARVEGRLLRGQGALREALAAFDRGLALLPRDPTLMLNVAEVRQLLGENEAAERAYRDLIDAHPRCAPAMVSYGTLLSAAGRTAEAERMYRQSFAVSPTSRAAYNLAVLLMKAGRFADARPYAEATVALDPADPDARELLEMLRGK